MAPLVVLLLGAAAGALRAQVSCDGRQIGRITVTTRSLFTVEESRIPTFLQRLGNSLHWQTQESTVRRELLFGAGEPCDRRRLAETQRLLRAQPYLRSATVVAQESTGETVDVHVTTFDDWSLRGSARIETGGTRGPIRRLRIAEENLWGRGLRAQLRFNNEGRQPGVDVAVSTRQLFGQDDADFLFGRSSVGPVAEQSVLHAFESEFDRTAWREATRYRKEPFLLTSPALGLVVQPIVLTGFDAGIAQRFGRPGLLAITGGLLSYERLFIEGDAFAWDAVYDSAAAATLRGQWRERRRVRAHLLLGGRALKFVQRGGIDAVNAAEDIRLGFEGGLVGGATVLGGRRLQQDRFGAAEFYAGAQLSARTLAFARGKWEGRYHSGAWDGVIAWGDVVAYHTSSNRTTMVYGVTAAGGWNNSTPFQLTLAGPFGLRGFGGAGLPVARRIVAHAERRTFRGVVLGAVDLGTALFVDAGQGWGGHVPFGEDTGFLGSIGAGLRAAFPSGSRLTYRLDIAVPLRGGHGLELRTGFRQQFGILRGESEDVIRSREQVSSVTVFNFPRF
ncbi:MAG: hypothetical protein A2085_03795 [Gemmatimonadetes bacterium GWC2_71_10]|nr:MAG: hypothetical protein A2085_03795 [Gemmatimonadetes bacterium GWC2_71_10]